MYTSSTFNELVKKLFKLPSIKSFSSIRSGLSNAVGFESFASLPLQESFLTPSENYYFNDLPTLGSVILISARKIATTEK